MNDKTVRYTRSEKTEATRDKLLEAGISLLSEQGYHGTGLKQILDVVKVPKGSFYNYFNSKEQFTAEIINEYSDWLLGAFDAILKQQPDDPRSAILQAYDVLIAHFEAEGCQKGCLIGNLAAEIGGSSDACRDAMRRTLRLWKQRFVVLVAEGQSKGQFRRDVPAEALTDLFWSTWEGALLRMRIDRDTVKLRQQLDLLLNTLYR